LALGAQALFAQNQTQKPIVVTGARLVITQKGSVIASYGRSKAFDGENTIYADEMVYDKNSALIKARGHVIINTTSGTIKADNALYISTLNAAYMVKDKNRPEADIVYEGTKGFYEADKMTFFNYESKKVLMEGAVKGRVNVKKKTQTE
jgi:lipopolysaccharide assembly outer membrane protein LptD (OstA)